MHYGDTRPDILTFDPFKAIIAPRPIGWIGTRNAEGVPNLGPYSFFNAIGNSPHMICFTSDGLKHSVVNARDRGEFTFSLATEALAQAMNVSSEAMPDGANEFDKAGLTLGTSIETDAPFVAESPAALECVTLSVTELTDRTGSPINRFMVIGQVVQTHIRDEYITGGRFDTVKARPISRMGYRDYATVTEAWELIRPDD
ncbi:flavin reductase family protein [Alloyangia pacifica]|uniref:NADH-FMN oxidoreductase RutF, flavin reductase (DIM6/NTAB) family n=1 Tax=Alloyangia pacifica TaxID=311180 RepID=A0A1I6VWE6_9RHOB|nr:flavin reductase family protein [Alloyangia pacifica]SDI23160.1 NADH-FMN oxidoreductase RutF, flavin reductase (DIM6/NTAB) family [Alloyangia pacifica]SFT17911.1 NADH-FMN oxidoreductase RutF, flavin reductase (DIM6/NTAB) family [Alloyangia pacifica]